MWQYVFKVAITSAIVVAVAEIAKRSPLWAAFVASLPLTSLLAFIWLYIDTGESERIAVLSLNIFWLVLPSLALFLVLPLLLRAGWGFWSGLGFACIVTIAAYLTMMWGFSLIGIHL